MDSCVEGAPEWKRKGKIKREWSLREKGFQEVKWEWMEIERKPKAWGRHLTLTCHFYLLPSESFIFVPTPSPATPPFPVSFFHHYIPLSSFLMIPFSLNSLFISFFYFNTFFFYTWINTTTIWNCCPFRRALSPSNNVFIYFFTNEIFTPLPLFHYHLGSLIQ